MKPFNLLVALKGGDVITRNGKEVVLTSYEVGELFPLRGVIIRNPPLITVWSIGGFHEGESEPSEFDLFMNED